MNDDRDVPSLPPVDPAAAGQGPAAPYSPELLASLLADGDDDLAAWTIGHALAETPRAEVYDGLVADAMRLVGQRWESGRWSVAEEHLASGTLLRTLERIRPELGTAGRIGPVAVLAAVAGEHHMIGLVCLDHVLREGGWTVAMLGADVPTADLGTFISRNDAALVALTASDPARLGNVMSAIAATRAVAPEGCPIMLGGRLAAQPGIAATLELDWAGSSLTGAARFAETVVARLSVQRA